MAAIGCGAPDGGLFDSSSAGAGGSVSATSASSSSSSSSSASSGGSGGSSGSASTHLFWVPGVQIDIPQVTMTGWKECFAHRYADTSDTQAQILAMCPGSKLALACRLAGSALLSVVAMDQRSDVTFQTDENDVMAQHVGSNDVTWYFSPYQWGFLPAGDQRKGGCDATGISPNAPGPNGDRRVCWNLNAGQMWVGYRCGYLSWENTPGFDDKYERVVLTAD